MLQEQAEDEELRAEIEDNFDPNHTQGLRKRKDPSGGWPASKKRLFMQS